MKLYLPSIRLVVLCAVAFALGMTAQYYRLPARALALVRPLSDVRPLVHDTLRGDDSVPREEVSPNVLRGMRVWVPSRSQAV